MHVALARKYRPQNFGQLLGQDAIVKTMQNALTHHRLHHAYLFCGARGVGKTSLARIMAKSINCLSGPTATPCQTCSVCVGITQGHCLDVLEIDGASHNSVDNIRELREQVKYLPQQARYKIYIIDEVHMLSNSAFNALLKTLEEPPAHVIFIFATTEPHVIPLTILSRCQKFDFKKLSTEALVAHLENILTQENFTFDDGAVLLVARCAQGSVRDALSLLDQILGFGEAHLKEQTIRHLLGLADRLFIQEAFAHLVLGNVTGSLHSLNDVELRGLDLKLFAEDLLTFYRHLILMQSTQVALSELSPSENEFFKNLVGQKDLSLLLAQYQVLFQGLQDLTRSDFQKISLEITFVKIGHIKDLISVAELVKTLSQRMTTASSQKNPSNISPSSVSTPATVATPTVSAKKSAENTSALTPAKDWYELVAWLQQEKPSLGGLLGQAIPVEFNANLIQVAFQKQSPSFLLAVERKTLLQELIQKHFQKNIVFEVVDQVPEKKSPVFLN